MPARRIPAPGVIVLLWAAVYLPRLLAGFTLPARDIGATHIPWRQVWADQLRAGDLPLWDPASNQGRPLLANPNAMAAYPGTLLFLLTDPESAAAWHLALHHLLLLAGCYLLARRSGAEKGPSLVAAAVAATTGVAWSVGTFLNSQAALAWAPFALAAVLPSPDDPRGACRRGLLAGVPIGLAFLAGEPITAALAGLGVVVVVFGWASYRPRGMGLAALAALGIAAPVLLPLLAVYPDTIRGALGTAPGALAADALAPRRWLELLLPGVLGAPLGDVNSGFWAARSFPWQRYYPTIFLGSLPLLLVPFARGRAMRPFWLLVAIGVGGSVALGIPPFARAVERLPLAGNLRFGVKVLQLAMLALVPLLAAGYAAFSERWRASGRRAATGACAVVVVLAPLVASGPLLRSALGRIYPTSAVELAEVQECALRRAALTDLGALAAPLATVALAGPSAPLVAIVGFGANAVAARDVRLWDRSARWSEPPEAWRAVPDGAPIAVFLHADGVPRLSRRAAIERFADLRSVLVPSYATRWGTAYVLARGPDGLEPLRQELLAAAAAALPIDERARVARALGAAAVIAERPVTGWDARDVGGAWISLAPEPAPAVYLATRALPAEGFPATVQALASEAFRPGQDAVIEGRGGAEELAGGVLEVLAGPAHRRRFEVDCGGSALLVVQQSAIGAWRAAVDGQAVPTQVVNGAMVGIRVPGGRHRVELSYDSRPLQAGITLALLAIAAVLLSLVAVPLPGPQGPTDASARSFPARAPRT
ncbi:MAG: hypothetical protein ACOY3Y_20805 [Acidobacteriota bacterium]